MILRSAARLCTAFLLCATTARAELRVTYDEALARAKQRAPSIAVIRATEQVAEAESRIAGIYPNPSVSVGTNSDAAHLALAASVPLVILGQRGAARSAGRAEYEVAKLDGLVSLTELRAATAHAFVALWLAERTARARAESARVSERLEASVQSRVEVGSSPALEGLRAHADRLRTELDARSAEAAVDAAAAGLAVWVGAGFEVPLRAQGDPRIPDRVPDLNELSGRIAQTPSVQRALADLRASQARAASERAQVRPLMRLDFGADFYDPTAPGVPNYHAALGVEVPLLNQRGPLIEREERRTSLARAQVRAEQARLSADLIAGYRVFGALTVEATTLADEVLPAADSVARATTESYTLGRAPLLAVLDAERARIDAELGLLDRQSARANAWIDIERALGVQ